MDAAKCLANLPPTEEASDEAISFLNRRFGRRMPRINAIITAILKLPQCSSTDTVKELRAGCDSMNAHVRSLKTMVALAAPDGSESEEASAVLGPILFSRLPQEICLKWYDRRGDEGIKVKDLLEFLENQVEGRELSEAARLEYGRKEKKPSPETSGRGREPRVSGNGGRRYASYHTGAKW